MIRGLRTHRYDLCRGLSRRQRMLLILIAASLYALIFPLLFRLAGPGGSAASVFLIALVGWLLGQNAGILAGLLSLPFNTVLLNLVGDPGWNVIIREGGLIGAIGSIFIAAIAGWLGDTLDRFRAQTRELEHERAALKEQIVERERIERALLERDVRLRLLFEQLPAVLWTTDRDMRMTSGMGAGLQALNIQPGQLTGVSLYDLFQTTSPHHPPIAATRQALAGDPSTYTWNWAGREFQVHVEPFIDRSGQIIGSIGLALDITERRRIEEGLQRRDAILEAVGVFAARFLESACWTEHIQEVLALLGRAADVSRVYLFENHAAPDGAQITSQRYEWAAPGLPEQSGMALQQFVIQPGGYDRWEVSLRRGEPIYTHIRTLPEEQRAMLAARDVRSIAIVPVFAGAEWWGHIGFDQCQREREWSAAEIDALKAAAGILGATIQRNRAETTLRESERRYRDLFDAARRQAQELSLLDQIRTALARDLGLHDIFRIVVEAIVETLGYTHVCIYTLQGDALGLQHQVGYLSAPAEIPVAKGVCGRVARTAQPALVADVRGDAAFFTNLAEIESEICVPLLDQGQVVGVLNVESSGARLSENDLQMMIAIAGHINIAIERARLSVLERKLLEAQKLESLGVLAGGIAHDFNNLLMAILGNAELALFDLPDGAAPRESITQIQLAARRAADLTGQMLAYAGKGRFVVGCIDLNLLVEEITALLNVSIAKTTLLRYNLSALLPAVEGDATQLRQVVMNLVINAAEAIGDREGLITVRTDVRQVDRAYLATMYLAPDLPAGRYVALEVADNGAGMTAETLAKIFDPFFTTKFTGRGLGLAAVLGIVRGHGGALKVESAPGRGTTFTILLPASESPHLLAGTAPRHEQTDTERQGAQEQAGPAQPVPGHGASCHGTVLVVDDEVGVRTVAARMLERAGYTVISAGEGRAGVELFRERADEIAIVLLDMTMPQMNGEDALRALRGIPSEVPAVIMSGYDEHELNSRFAGLEPVSFLQKPFTPAALREKIGRALVEQAA